MCSSWIVPWNAFLASFFCLFSIEAVLISPPIAPKRKRLETAGAEILEQKFDCCRVLVSGGLDCGLRKGLDPKLHVTSSLHICCLPCCFPLAVRYEELQFCPFLHLLEATAHSIYGETGNHYWALLISLTVNYDTEQYLGRHLLCVSVLTIWGSDFFLCEK